MESLEKVLENATSLDVENRSLAMQKLNQWEMEPNYHAALQQIYLNTKNDVKNGITKYWRKSAKGAIQPDERLLIKKNQLDYLHEPLIQLATAQAVATSKIARFDFPNEWPELLDILIPIVQSSFDAATPSNYPLRFNSLYTLHLSMKALTTKTLPMARKMAQMVTPNVFKYVLSLYSAQVNVLFLSIQEFESTSFSPSEIQIQQLAIARISLKSLRRLVINGYVHFSESSDVLKLFELLSVHYPQFLNLQSSMVSQSQLSPFFKLLNSLILLVGKLIIDATQERVIDYILCPSSITLCSYMWSLLSNNQVFSGQRTSFDELMINVHIQVIKIFKNLASHKDFNIISAKDKDTRLDKALHKLETELFVPQFVVNAAKLLVTRYMVLDDEALESWENEPEEFINEIESDQWEFNRRACAEKLLMILVIKNKTLLCPMLIEALNSLPPLSTSSTKDSILLKEAMYCAIGINAHYLTDAFPFDEWLRNVLLMESKVDVQGSNIIKRSITVVISNWIGVQSSKIYRGIVYEILLFYLQQSDIVLRLSSVSALQIVLDDFDFEMATFSPFLNHYISSFMKLLEDVDEFDSKLKIINCLIVIIERMEGQIFPYITPLIEILPTFWGNSEGQNMFRASIVSIIAKLVKTLRGESYQLIHMVLPVLHTSLDVSSPGHLHLFEEGIDLWLATLQNAATCTPELLNFIPAAISFMEIGNENLRKILHILEAYIVLTPLETLRAYADPLFIGVSSKLGNFTAEASRSILRLIDLTLQSCQQASCFPALFQVIVVKGVLMKMMNVVLVGEELNTIIIGFLMVLNQIAIYDAAALLSNIIQQGGEAALDRYLNVILEKYDSLSNIRHRKMTALGLLAMIGTGHNLVLSKLIGIFSILTSVAAEVSNIDKLNALRFTFETRDGDEDEDSLDYARRKTLHQSDLLYNHDMFRPFVISKIQECQKNTGVNPVQSLASMDQEIYDQVVRIIQ